MLYLYRAFLVLLTTQGAFKPGATLTLFQRYSDVHPVHLNTLHMMLHSSLDSGISLIGMSLDCVRMPIQTQRELAEATSECPSLPGDSKAFGVS